MAYELPADPQYQIPAFAEIWAIDRVTMGNQFNIDLVTRYQDNYENFWSIGRSNVTTELLNVGLQRLDGTGLRMIAEAGMYVYALKQMLGDAFPDRLMIPPRPYSLKSITFQDGHTVAELATFAEYFALAAQHGHATAGYVEVGELLEGWSA
jgi:hypothetical protein